MRKRTSFAAIGALMLLVTLLSGRSFAQGGGLFNYDPYPGISDNEPAYYPDAQYLVPDALPGGQRYFLVPVFFTNCVDPRNNPNTANGFWPGPAGRTIGVDGQFLEPIRSFSFQMDYPNQAIELDPDPSHGSPIMTVGPTTSSLAENAWASSFYFHYTDQSANDPTNPFNRIIRVTAASEVPLPMTPNCNTDSTHILCYLRFHIIPNWTVNTAILQLDTARWDDHPGDPQYDPNNWVRGNIGGHPATFRGRLPVLITAQPVIELRPFSEFSTTDGKNYTLLPEFIYDPANSASNLNFVQLQIDNSQGSSRITNLSVVVDQTWLKIGQTSNPTQSTLFFSHLTNFNTQNQIIFETATMFIGVNASGLQPGVYIGHVTMQSEGAGNSPLRITVTLVVRAQPNEGTSSPHPGVTLHLLTSCNPQCESIVSFGTANQNLSIPDATDGIDILYGETPFYQSDAASALANADPSKHCYAYFSPLNRNVDPAFADPNLLGTSRDFRSRTADSTLLFQVHFNTGGPLCYPLSVCFDPTDLPDGARFIIRDVVNGSLFTFDMREATPTLINGVPMNCITIHDANINAFDIEYTPARIGQTAALQTRAWNFISLPVIPSDKRPSVIFPNSSGDPYKYASNTGWGQEQVAMQFGRGYMIHYGTILDGPVIGARSLTVGDQEAVRMHEGWNSVGAASVATCIQPSLAGSQMQTVFLSSVPGGSLTPDFTSDFFQYTPGHGYSSVVYLLPGHGYFVKVSDESNYHVHVNPSCKSVSEPDAQFKSELIHATVSDATQNAQDLYFGNMATVSKKNFEMPPSFTDFDARFTTTNGMISPSGDEHIVKLASKNYPVAMNFDNVFGTVEVRDMNGNILGVATNGGSVVIGDKSVKTVILSLKGSTSQSVPGYSLGTNVPNPFGSTTAIGYSVPAEMFVTITVSNALGQVITTPVNGVVSAGSHTASFDATNLSDGTYFYTIHAGSFTQTEKMTVTK